MHQKLVGRNTIRLQIQIQHTKQPSRAPRNGMKCTRNALFPAKIAFRPFIRTQQQNIEMTLYSSAIRTNQQLRI
jgi:hypothetical protein